MLVHAIIEIHNTHSWAMLYIIMLSAIRIQPTPFYVLVGMFTWSHIHNIAYSANGRIYIAGWGKVPVDRPNVCIANQLANMDELRSGWVAITLDKFNTQYAELFASHTKLISDISFRNSKKNSEPSRLFNTNFIHEIQCNSYQVPPSLYSFRGPKWLKSFPFA